MSTCSLKTWVVEDDSTYQQKLLSYLGVLGINARGFSTGEECLKHLHENPDVVILDHNLGSDMLGIDVLRNIKIENKDISVIYISGEEKVSLVSDAYRNGSDDYIGKDSASLLRLKLRLEKIAKVKLLRLKKKRNKRLLYLILTSGMVTIIIWLLLTIPLLK